MKNELYKLSKIDSLKDLRPKYKTKAGRTVYGGGGSKWCTKRLLHEIGRAHV